MKERKMNCMKRVFTLILCLALVFCMTIQASAAKVTFKDSAADATYTAYKLLDVDAAAGDSSYSYSVNDAFRAFWTIEAGARPENETDSDFGLAIVSHLANVQSNSVQMNELAKRAYAYVNAVNGDEIEDNNVNGKTVTGTEINLDSGYYLIVESAVSTTDKKDTVSLHMLSTVGNNNIDIYTKESAPYVEKEVRGKNDSTNDPEHYRTYADYDVGDEMEFRITGHLSGRYGEYNNYYYEFVDTMSGGLVSIVETKEGKERPKNAKIMIGNYDVTDEFDFTVTKDDKGYVVSFSASADLKTIDTNHNEFEITNATTILLTYTGKLVDDAESSLVYGGEGNPNEVYLKYQRDPYATGNPDEGEEGQTPPDKNVVFTFKASIDKVGPNAEGTVAPLGGATFTLEKYINASLSWQEVKKIGPDAEITTFEFNGLDAGQYRLTEEAPAGYYPIRPFEFVIAPMYDTSKDPAELTDLKITDVDGANLGDVLDIDITVSEDHGTFSTTILNTKGGTLPTTGGSGTTMIYIAGGILVLAAIVLLVTKKRMTNAD